MSSVLVMFGGYGDAHSGAERMAWRTTGRLAARGHCMVVRTDSIPPVDLGGGVVRVLAPDNDTPAAAPELVHAYDLGKPQLVSRALSAAQAYRVPFVLTPATDPQLWPDPRLGRVACETAAAIYTLTEAEEKALRFTGVSGDRFRRIAQAPDLVGSPDTVSFRARHLIEGPIVLFAGRRIATKGYRQLLECAPLVLGRLPEATFVFVGPGGDPSLRGAAADVRTDRRILDLGAVSDQERFDAIAACDLLALPTTADVFPLVFVEAWSCGRPVVSGRFPGVENVVRGGVDGLIVGSGVDQLAGALLMLLTDHERRTAMGAAGLARSRTEFGWDRTAADVEAGYRVALGRHQQTEEEEDSSWKTSRTGK